MGGFRKGSVIKTRGVSIQATKGEKGDRPAQTSPGIHRKEEGEKFCQQEIIQGARLAGKEGQ